MPRGVKLRLDYKTRDFRHPMIIDKGYDETDKTPDDLTVTVFEIGLYISALIGIFTNLAISLNLVLQYYLSERIMEACLTVCFLMLPLIVNTFVSLRMFMQDLDDEMMISKVKMMRPFRIVMMVFLQAHVMHIVMCLIFATKAHKAGRKGQHSKQRKYYQLMLKEDSDIALMKIFECFLEAAPQKVLQLTLLMKWDNSLNIYQLISITSSMISLGWSLTAYQRAIRFAQEDKENMSWVGSGLQTLWHFLVTTSRIVALVAVASVFPKGTIILCAVHILAMTMWLLIFDRSPFCSFNFFAEILFSLVLGSVYLFTYILPVEGRTRYRYTIFYTICFLENFICAWLWYINASEVNSTSVYFYVVIGMAIVPFILGILVMVLYYTMFHPKLEQIGYGVAHAQAEDDKRIQNQDGKNASNSNEVM